MKVWVLAIFTSFGLLNNTRTQAQSTFDKAEEWLINKHLTVSYGVLKSWYKYSNIRYVDNEYNRDIEYFSVLGEEISNINTIKKGEITTAQTRLAFGIDLSKNYSVVLHHAHINYYTKTDVNYYTHGNWDGTYLSDKILFSNHFKHLEHSNGINIWNVGLRRNFDLLENKKKTLKMFWGVMPNAGIVHTASQATLLNPLGQWEKYDPQNHLAGFDIALETNATIRIKNHLELSGNFNFFQLYIKRAKLHDNAFISQRLRGSYYGATVGWKF